MVNYTRKTYNVKYLLNIDLILWDDRALSSAPFWRASGLGRAPEGAAGHKAEGGLRRGLACLARQIHRSAG